MESTSNVKTPRRKRARRETGAATTTTTPPPTTRSSPGNGLRSKDDGARVVWRDSPAEKQIRVSGTGKLAQQEEVQGFVGRLARASGLQSPPGLTPTHGRDPYLVTTDSDELVDCRRKKRKGERCDQPSKRSSLTRLVPVTGLAITPPLPGHEASSASRHILFSPESEATTTTRSRHHHETVAVVMTTTQRSRMRASSRAGESQDELMLLDQLDERLSRETPEDAHAQTATVSTVPLTSAFMTPPRPDNTRVESSVTTEVTPPVTVQQKLEFESPDFTEESWELLDQLEFQASQQITNRRNGGLSQSTQSQMFSQQVLPPAPTPRPLRHSVVVSSTKHSVSPSTEAHPVVVTSPHATAQPPPTYLENSPAVDKRLSFDEAVSTDPEKSSLEVPDANFKRLLVLEVDRDHYHRRVVMRLLGEEENHIEIELRADWYDTNVDAGDTVHLILSERDSSGFFSRDYAASVCQKSLGLVHANGVQRVIVDNDHHLIIVHPDILVSPTRVTTSFECLRRAVLNETLNVSRPTNPNALLGTLKHELFQRGLESSRHDIEFMLAEAQRIVSSNVLKLIESNVTEETALRELGNVMQDYRKWLIDSSHGGVQLNQVPGGTTKVSLHQVLTVEEMLWSIKWGLKGATDATIQASFSPLDGGVVIPLELKTGSKKYGGVQHQGQVMLYTLMLSERYRQRCQDGLLMYVPGIETNRISAMASHIRGLIIARNKFATAMARVKAMGSSSSSHHQQALPSMLRRKHDCGRCFQIQECVLHHAAVENGSAESSGLEELFQRQVGHLEQADLAYFRKWNRLIDLEHQNADKNLRALWLQSGSRRERDPDSLCVSKLRLVSDNPAPEGSSGSATMRILLLRRDQRAPPDLISSSFLELRFRVDDRVIISVESIDEKNLLVHVARGRIAGLTSDSIVLETFQSIPSVVGSGESIVGSEYTWRIDKDAIVSSLSRAKENLVKLLVGPAPEEITEGTATHLRADLLSNAISQVMPSQAAEQIGDVRRKKLVVHLLKPRFRSSKFVELLQQRRPQRSSPQNQTADLSHQLHDEYSRLNIDQQRGVMKVLNSLDYALILGMPGTGKTSTIAFTVKVLVHLGFSVLITSYTHSAVDNLLLKLLASDIPMIRVGSSKQVHSSLVSYTLEHSIGGEGSGKMSVEAVEARIKGAKVVGCTCLGVNSHVLFSKRRFDFCIVDEATQTTEPVVLGPLRCADTFVLVGDHYQLPPLVSNAQAKKEGMDVSLFRRLSEAHPEATQQLSYQYRMNSDIMMLANRLIYADKLKCGSHEVSSNQLALYLPVELQSPKIQAAWPLQVLQSRQGVRFINTDGVPDVGEKSVGYAQVRSRKLENVVEARVVAVLVQLLIAGGVPPAEIAVISPFRAQVSVIVQQLRDVMGPAATQIVEVSTIDKYQGKDKDVVLVSFVRCNPENHVGELLTDWRRINVALTRAKQKLILVGSKQTLCAGSSLFHTLMELIVSRHWEVPLPATAMCTLTEVIAVVRPHSSARLEALQGQVEPEPEIEPVVMLHQQASHDIEALVSSGVPIRRNGVGPSRQWGHTRGPIINDIMGEYGTG